MEGNPPARKPSDYDLEPIDMLKGPDHIALKYLNKRLVTYGITRRKHEEKGRRTDRILHDDPKFAIHQLTEYQFRLTFAQWFYNVDTEIRKYERKLDIENFQKTGQRKGFWGNPFGVKFSHYFPSFCGMHFTSPPPYFSVWGNNEREVFNCYEMTYHRRKHVHQLFWATLGFTMMASGQIIASLNRNRFIPKNPIYPFLAAFVMSVFPGSFFNFFTLTPKKESMAGLLDSQGSFLSAKARLIADDVMFPEVSHHREFLEYVPRDDFDSFVYSHTDEDIAFGNFDKERWNFVLRENQPKPLPLTWENRKEKFDEYYHIILGKGFQYRLMKQKEAKHAEKEAMYRKEQEEKERERIEKERRELQERIRLEKRRGSGSQRKNLETAV